MAFTPQFLDELKTRLTLSDYVGKRVKLVKKGREFSGLCPFHNEKTPSFTVNDDKGFYHCFGCGAHGSVLDWSMQTEGLSFPEAVERLAGDAGMAVPQQSPRDRARAERAKTLLDANEAACLWFQKQLHTPAGREALAYLEGRGLTAETMAQFRLGFAPDQRDGLQKGLASHDFPEALLIEAGLIARPDDGRAPYDRFRGRVIFPITDRRGRVIAFGGRILADREGVAKYLNSPETPLFHKGRTLYAIAEAREAAANGADVLVTEGYMDVIALHQAGFRGAVAPLGTALTEDQIQLLWRLQPEPVLCLDGDNAGQRAAARAAARALPLLKPGHSLRFALLPSGEDPDSLVQSQGPEAMTRLVGGARPLVDQVWQMETVGRPKDTPERRALIRKALRDRCGEIAERSVQEAYWAEFETRLSELFGRKPPRTQDRGNWGGKRPPGRYDRQSDTGLRTDGDPAVLLLRARQALLAAVINHPEILDDVEEALGTLDFSPAGGAGDDDGTSTARRVSHAPGTVLGDLDRLRQEILTIPRENLDSRGLQDHLQSLGFAASVAKLLSPEVYALAAFAAPSADSGKALDGWRALYGSLREREALEREFQAARQALAADMSARNWDHLSALSAARQRRRHQDGDEVGDERNGGK